MQFDNQSWTDDEDKVLLHNLKAQRESKKQIKFGVTPQHKSLEELCHLMGRKPEEIQSRMRYIQPFVDLHETPPKLLLERLSISKCLWVKLWRRATTSIPQFGLRNIVWLPMKRRLTSKRGVERDVDDFLKAYIAMLKRKCNMRDLEQSRAVRPPSPSR